MKRKKIVWPGGELLNISKLFFKPIKWGMIIIIPNP